MPQGADGRLAGQIVFSASGGSFALQIFVPVAPNHPLAGTIYGDSIEDASDIWYDPLSFYLSVMIERN